MLAKVWVRVHGGWWSHRQRMLRARGLRRRLYVLAYKRHLEGLGGYVSVLAEFDGPPHFPHKPMGVFIAPGARIGRDVTIFQHVTIGRNGLPSSPGFGTPTIGDRVLIGAGAQIVGGVHVGSDARIGAGVVVARDVPAGATVVSAPPRVIVRS